MKQILAGLVIALARMVIVPARAELPRATISHLEYVQWVSSTGIENVATFCQNAAHNLNAR